MTSPASAATTYTVDDDGIECPAPDFSNLQAAVDAAVDGDTIQVCAGAYNEQVSIDEALTLNGPNAGTSALDARMPEASVTSSVFTFFVTDGTGVTIDGFEISGGEEGIRVTGSTTNTLVQNNIISGTLRALTLEVGGDNTRVLNNDLFSDERSFHVADGPYTNLKVNGNRFSGDATTGVQFCCTSDVITGFEFKDNAVHHLANIGVNITGGDVSGNTFDPGTASVLGLQIGLHDSTLTNNTFLGGPANAACFQLFGSQNGLTPSSSVTISGNTFQDCGANVLYWNYAIQLSPDIDGITIADNTITNAYEGINTRDVTAWDLTGAIAITHNEISGSRNLAVNNTTNSGTLNTEDNWWGAASGPSNVGGTGDTVAGDVDVDPWCVNADCTPPPPTPDPTPTPTDPNGNEIETPPGADPLPEEVCDPATQSCGSDGDDDAEVFDGTVITGPGEDDIHVDTNENTTNVVIDAGPDDDTVVATIGEGTPEGTVIEIDGGDGDDSIIVDIPERTINIEIIIIGAEGNDTITYPNLTGIDGVTVITTTGEGDDVLNVPPAPGTVRLIVRLGTGSDSVVVQTGVGAASVGWADAAIDGGMDVYGGAGRDLIHGSAGGDLLIGGKGRDVIRGARGNDVIRGRNAPDALFGGYGDDFLSGGAGRDFAKGGPGDDQRNSI